MAAAGSLNAGGGKYHVLIRGIESGTVVDRVEPCESVSRALAANSQCNEVLEVATSPHLRVILSNTTEKGYDLDPADEGTLTPPRSFPAKLTAVLFARYRAGLPGVAIVPCEFATNTRPTESRRYRPRLAKSWDMGSEFLTYLGSRMPLAQHARGSDCHRHPGRSSYCWPAIQMLTACEPYARFAIEDKPDVKRWIHHPGGNLDLRCDPLFPDARYDY
jgi:tagaturonate reductase